MNKKLIILFENTTDQAEIPPQLTESKYYIILIAMQTWSENFPLTSKEAESH